MQKLPAGLHRVLHNGKPRLLLVVPTGTSPWALGEVVRPSISKSPLRTSIACPCPAGSELEPDFALLADIFPTGYHGAVLADVSPGESVAVFGAGPVGIMAAYSCAIRGAAEIYVVDHVQDRLDKATELGGVPINFDRGDPVQQIKERRGGDGVDKAIDAVGYQAAAAGSSAGGRRAGRSAKHCAEPVN